MGFDETGGGLSHWRSGGTECPGYRRGPTGLSSSNLCWNVILEHAGIWSTRAWLVSRKTLLSRW